MLEKIWAWAKACVEFQELEDARFCRPPELYASFVAYLASQGDHYPQSAQKFYKALASLHTFKIRRRRGTLGIEYFRLFLRVKNRL